MAIKTPEILIKDQSFTQKIINGNMDLWQRGSERLAQSSSAFLADRFKYLIEGGVVQANVRRSTDVPTVAESGFASTYSMEVEISTAESSPGTSAFLGIQYSVEGYDYAELAGGWATLSFWAKSSAGGTYSVALLNNGSTTSYVSEFSLTANLWTKITLTFLNDGTSVNSGDWNYTNGAGLRIVIALMSGATAQTAVLDSWESSSARASSNQANLATFVGNVFRLAQVSLNEGRDALKFKRAGKNISEEITIAQRYYEKTYNLETAPNTSGGPPGAYRVSSMMNAAGDVLQASISFKKRKRATPTVTCISPSGVSGQFNWIGTSASSASATAVISVESEISFQIAASGLSGGARGDANWLDFHWTADAEIA